jgi:hypothetical protein
MAIIWRFSENSSRLVSENLRSSKRKIRSSNSDYSYSNRRSFVFRLPIILSRNIAILGGKYEARIAIFRIFAAINRIFPDFSESGKPLSGFLGKRKAVKENCKFVSRYRNKKCVEESGKPLQKSESRWRRFSRISRKSESRWRKSNFERRKSDFWDRKISIFPTTFSSFWRFWGLVFDTKFATMCAHGFTWYVLWVFNYL